MLSYISSMTTATIIRHLLKVALNTEESPNDFDKNHQVKVDAHLVV
jgi:hypothetical protein